MVSILILLCMLLPVMLIVYLVKLSQDMKDLKLQVYRITQHVFSEVEYDSEEETDKKIIVVEEEVQPESIITEPVIEDIQYSHNKQNINQNLEKTFGTKITAWIGGIALIFSGFYLVKYSIEHSILTPFVRIIIGAIFAICALGAAHYIHQKPDFPNGNTIAQSLSGTGIATLYGCLFAAGNLYDLLSNTNTFIGMAIVTIIAVLSSLRHGPYVALLGLLGGFLTPVFVGSTEPSAPLFFGYLYLLFTGLMVVARQKGWWTLSLINVTGALLWSIAWGVKYPQDLIWVNLFLFLTFMTISAITHAVVKPLTRKNISSITPVQLLSYGGLSACLLVVASFSATIQFTLQDWGLFYLLVFATFVLTYLKPKLYSYATYMLIPISGLMLYAWNESSLVSFLIIFSAFALSYILGGYYMVLKSKKAGIGAIITSLSSVTYFVCLFMSFEKRSQDASFVYELPSVGLKLLHATVDVGIPFFWDTIFTALCLPMAYYLYSLIRRNSKVTVENDKISASFLTGITLLCLTYIHFRFEQYSLNYVYPLLAVGLAYLGRFFAPKVLWYPLMPLALYAIIHTILSLVDCDKAISEGVLDMKNISDAFSKISIYAHFETLATAVLFGVAAKKLQDIKLQKFSLFATLAFVTGSVAAMHNSVGMMTYDFSRDAHHLVYCFLLLSYIGLSLIFYRLGRCIKNIAMHYSGYIMSTVAIMNILNGHLIDTPWQLAPVFGYFGWNTLLLFYALPALGMFMTSYQWRKLGHKESAKILSVFALFLSMAWASLNVRFYFHTPYLLKGLTSNTELYTYSALWLTIGLALVALGIKMKNQLLRFASLAILLITIGKVFLFDASHLDGLYRVASFFGLGVSLLALSYFYSRFVFTDARSSIAKKQ